MQRRIQDILDMLDSLPGTLALGLVIIALYGTVAFYHLGDRDLTFDELISSDVIRKSPSELVSNRWDNGHPPLYFLMLKGWVALTDHKQVPMGALSILIGALAIPVIIVLGRELGLGPWAWAAGLLWALHPGAIFFASEIRPYVGAGLLGALALWSILRALRLRTWKACVPAMLVAIAGAGWNLNLIWLWIGLLVAVLMAEGLTRRTIPGVWVALGLGLGGQLAALIYSIAHTGGTGPIDWITTPNAGRLLKIFLKFLGGDHLTNKHVSWTWIFPVFMAVTVVVEGLRRIAENPGQPAGASGNGSKDFPLADRWRLVAWATLLPLLIMLIATYTVHPLILGRYLLPLLPGAVMLLTAFLARLRWQPLAVGLCLFLAMLALINDHHMQRQRETGLRYCIAKLEQRYQPGDVVMTFNPSTVEALRLYSNVKYRAFVVWRYLRPERGWPVFEKCTQNAKRLWVLAYWYEGGLMSSPQWASLEPNCKYVKKQGESKLIRYRMPVNVK